MKIYLTALCLSVISTTQAQRQVEETIPWQPEQVVSLELKYARDIRVQTWDRPELLVRASVSINHNAANDAWTMAIDTTAAQIRLVTNIAVEQIEEASVEACSGQSYHHTDGRQHCSRITYEVYLPRAAELQLETLSGNITLRGIRASVSAKSLSGFVDADWPNQRGATVFMSSVTGEVYTDLALALADTTGAAERRRSPVGWDIEGTVAGGGVPVRLESVSSDIYFRREGS